MSKFVLYSLIGVTLTLVACKKDKEVAINYDLEGRWEVYEALRNNALTNTLEDGYFIFEDSIMKTNIVGTEVEGKFSLVGDQFNHESALPVDYHIDYYGQDTLHLNTLIRGFQFDFKLLKVRDTIPVNPE
jgi:hypothetical protein